MAWSDAARAASAEVRRRNKAKRWYHGGTAVRTPFIKDSGSGVWATRDLKFARKFFLDRGADKSGRGAVYRVEPLALRAVKSSHWNRLRLIAARRRGQLRTTDVLHNFKGDVRSSEQSMRAFRLPTGKGRASRGKF